jgi:hypothetical protein
MWCGWLPPGEFPKWIVKRPDFRPSLRNVFVSRVESGRMKPVRRWLFNCVAAMSLLLFLATMAAWARSYFDADQITHDSTYSSQLVSWTVFSRGSSIGWQRVTFRLTGGLQFPMPNRPNWGLLSYPRSSNPTQMNGYPFAPLNLDFVFNRVKQRSTTLGGLPATFDQLVIECPDWSLLPAFAVLPTFWLILRRRRKPAVGVCSNCGYDLRATPERCPECGMVPAKLDNKAGGRASQG